MIDTELNSKSLALLRFIFEYLSENSRPPTQREMANELNLSQRQIRRNLDKLVKSGLLKKEKGLVRAIKISRKALKCYFESMSPYDRQTNTKGGLKIPIVGSIYASEPIKLDNELKLSGKGSEIYVSSKMLKNIPDKQNLVGLNIIGDSMIDALVAEGDIVLVHLQDRVQNGEMASIWIPSLNYHTLKRFYDEGEHVRLQPENPNFNPIYFRPEEVEVQVKVTHMFRRLVQSEPERWRLDASIPKQVCIGKAFTLTISIRPSSSSILKIEDSESNVINSTNLQIDWADSEPIKLKVQIVAPDFILPGPKDFITLDLRSFKYEYPKVYFLLTPKIPGDLKINVIIYREENWLGNTSLETESRKQIVGKLEFKTFSQNLDQNSKASLRRKLEEYFSIDELQTLCFDLDIEFENLQGHTALHSLTASLLQHCIRNHQVGDLLEYCTQKRPKAFV